MQLIDVIPAYHKDYLKNDLGLEELYIVMHWADTDLRRLIKSNTFLGDEQIKKMMYEILCGVHYIHSADIVHRDLKPGNILVNTD